MRKRRRKRSYPKRQIFPRQEDSKRSEKAKEGFKDRVKTANRKSKLIKLRDSFSKILKHEIKEDEKESDFSEEIDKISKDPLPSSFNIFKDSELRTQSKFNKTDSNFSDEQFYKMGLKNSELLMRRKEKTKSKL